MQSWQGEKTAGDFSTCQQIGTGTFVPCLKMFYSQLPKIISPVSLGMGWELVKQRKNKNN